MSVPRVVIVRRRTEYDELVARHGTRGQAEFFLQTREQSIEPVVHCHAQTIEALQTVARGIPIDWRRAEVERAELPRFVFEPGDIVVAVGQDGLVANAARYLHGQPVLGVDPQTGSNAGVLVPHPADDVSELLREVAAGRARVLERTMVQATSDDGQSLVALNELYVGQQGHQSARYLLGWQGRSERQSSSGVIIGTGTGATGWCASIQRCSAPGLALPRPVDHRLTWFVREAWPSPATGTQLVAGSLGTDALSLRVESEQLVTFGDGIESDRLLLGWGQQIRVSLAERVLKTVE